MDFDQKKYFFIKLVAMTALLLCTTGLNAFEQNQIKGRLLSLKDKAPISYASVLNITSKRQGTTTAEDGSFILKLDNIPLDHKILFSSLGFHDTTLVLSDLVNKDIALYLREKIYALPDYIISADGERHGKIGDVTIPLQREGASVAVTSPGYAQGVYIQPDKKEQGVLQSLKVHLSEELYNTPFYLRILRPQKRGRIKESDLYAMSSFSDILIEERLYIPEKQGWFDIDLSNYKISIDKEGLFILFVQIDKGEEFYRNSKWPTSKGNDNSVRLYGHSISTQKLGKEKIFTALYTGTSLGIIEKGDFTLAVEVKYIY